MENPIKMDDLGVPLFFGKKPWSSTTSKPSNPWPWQTSVVAAVACQQISNPKGETWYTFAADSKG